VRASNAAAVLIFQDLLLGDKTPPLKKAECLLGLPSFWKGKKPNTEKGGRRVISPRPLTILSCTPLLTSQTKILH